MNQYYPNLLTISRVLLIPFFLYFMITGNSITAIIIFSIASLTDFLDGYLARKFNLTSNFGIFFDPLADKLLTTSAFIGFMFLDLFNFQITWLMVAIILFRDVIITLLRIIMESNGISMITSKLGKLKTFLQMVSIMYMLSIFVMYTNNIMLYENLIKSKSVYYIMMITVIITLYTGLHYLYFNKQSIKLIFKK